jgi:hypothetical protein
MKNPVTSSDIEFVTFRLVVVPCYRHGCGLELVCAVPSNSGIFILFVTPSRLALELKKPPTQFNKGLFIRG